MKDGSGDTASIVAGGDGVALETLLKRGFSDPNERGHLGRTALQSAALHGNYRVVGKLLKAAADVTAKNDNGETALDLALAQVQAASRDTGGRRRRKRNCDVDHAFVARTLMRVAGADPNEVNTVNYY